MTQHTYVQRVSVIASLAPCIVMLLMLSVAGCVDSTDADAATFNATLGTVTAITTVVLAFLTARYVMLTNQMLRTMQSAREPYVDVEIAFPNLGELLIIISNPGAASARNVRFRILQDCTFVELGKERGSGYMHIFQEGLSYLPVGQRLIFAVGVGRISEALSSNEPVCWEAEITFENDSGSRFTRHVCYDLRQFRETRFCTFQNDTYAIVDALRELGRGVGKISDTSLSHMFGMPKLCKYCLRQVAGGTKKCPHCLEWIDDKADR